MIMFLLSLIDRIFCTTSQSSDLSCLHDDRPCVSENLNQLRLTPIFGTPLSGHLYAKNGINKGCG